jgi:hypothetical protein
MSTFAFVGYSGDGNVSTFPSRLGGNEATQTVRAKSSASWVLDIGLVDQSDRHFIEEFSEVLFGLFRQRSRGKRIIHQLHPTVSGKLIDSEWGMSRTQAGKSTLLDVSRRTSKPEDQEVAKTLLGPFTIILRVHGTKNIVVIDLAIESSG